MCFAYDNGPEIFRDASFQIANHSRVAIVGRNGAGKTTLLHLIQEAAQNRTHVLSKRNTSAKQNGQSAAVSSRLGGSADEDMDGFSNGEAGRSVISGRMTGGISVVPKAAVGLFEQNLSTLDYSRTVLENVMEVSIQKEGVARTTLSRLLFFESDMHKPAGILSGGERIKLAFARLFVSRVNLLILDEPTNYLDIPSIEALQAMFSEYEGTLIFVSHDEAFIRGVATEIAIPAFHVLTACCAVTASTLFRPSLQFRPSMYLRHAVQLQLPHCFCSIEPACLTRYQFVISALHYRRSS